MNPQFGVIAAEAREEIAFWPIATGGYLFVQTESYLVFITLIFAIVPAVVFYLFLKELRQLAESQSDLSLPQSNTNPEELSEQLGDVTNDLEEAGLTVNPIIIGVNAIFWALFYIQLVYRILVARNPELISVGLFLIPLVTIAVAITPVIR